MIRFLFVLALLAALGFQGEDTAMNNDNWLHLVALAGSTSALTLLFSWILSRFILLWAINRLKKAQIINDRTRQVYRRTTLDSETPKT